MFLLPSIVLMAMGLEKKKNQKKLLRKKLKFMRNFQLGSHLEGKRGDFHGMEKSIDICLYVCDFCYFFCVSYECFAQM